jgi:hypothetical protein
MTAGTVSIAPDVVPYFRRGVKREMSTALANLTFQVDNALDATTYWSALARFDAARMLIDLVGFSDETSGQLTLEVDLGLYDPLLVLRVLELQYDTEVMRLQDRAAEGADLPLHELPALGHLLRDVREKAGVPPRPKRSRVTTRFSVRRGRRGRH